jgi:hypothetical protein
MYLGVYVKYPLFLSDFKQTVLSTDFRKILKQNFTKIHSVGAESFHANGRTDGQTEMTKLIVAFRNFLKSPNNTTIYECKNKKFCDKMLKTENGGS